MIDVDERWVAGADDVIPCFHFLGVGGAIGDEWTPWIYADVELGGGRLVVGVGEASAYAGAIDNVMYELNS